MARWIVRLQEYSFQVKYRPGSENKVADTIAYQECLKTSTMFWLKLRITRFCLYIAMEQVSAHMFFGDHAKLALEQKKTMIDTLSQVMEALGRGERLVSNDRTSVRFRQIWDPMFLSEEGCLFRKFSLRGLSVTVPVFPIGLRLKILEDCHGSAQLGVHRTYNLLRVNAYWPGMESDVEKFVTTCDRCQLHKPSTNVNSAYETYFHVRAYGSVGDGYYWSSAFDSIWQSLHS